MAGLGSGPHAYDTVTIDAHGKAVALSSVGAARYTLVAIYCIVLYDWIVCFGTEVELVHRSRWTPVKVAYLFCRYYPILVGPVFLWAFLFDHDKHICTDAFRPVYFCLIPAQIAPQLILVLRAYAFTGRRRGTLILLGFCLLALAGTIIIIFAHDLVLSNLLFEVVERSGCFAMTDLGSDVGGWHLGAIFFGVFTLDALNAFIVIRHSIKNRSTLGSLGEAFLKQGVLVYICTTVVNIISAVMYYVPQRELNGTGSWLAWLLPSVLACRLVLVLRRKASPTQSEVMHQMSEMVNQALELVPAVDSDGGAREDDVGVVRRSGRVRGGDSVQDIRMV